WTGTNTANWQNECAIPAPDSDENICTRYRYDATSRPISSTNALGQTNLTFYDNAGRVVTSVVNYDGVTAVNTLCTDFNNPDPEYNLCSLTGYDQYGRVNSTTDSLGRITRSEYDSLGRVKGTIVNSVNVISLANCNFPPLTTDRNLCTLYQYDNVGNTMIVTDTMGRMTRTFYDELNRVDGAIGNWDGIITLNDCATQPRERDDNICTQYQYDEVGNTILVTNTLTQTTRTFYDELNRVSVTVANWQPGLTSPNQCVISPDNANDENICTLYGYDKAGNQITTTNALNQTSLTVYDAANRPAVQVSNWDGSTAIDTDGSGCATAYAADANLCSRTQYDTLGRRTAVTDPMGNSTDFAYDGLGRVTATTRYLNQSPISNLQSYDALGNRLTVTDAEGNTTSYEHDGLNRLIKTTTAEGVVTQQAYNAASWVITNTDGLGHTTIMDYDQMGRRISVTDPEGNSTAYEYDALGNQTGMIDAEEVRTATYYDDLNRLVRVIENQIFIDGEPTDPINISTYYAYDALGNRVVITNALNFTSSYTLYDDLNRPVVVEDALGNQTRTAYNALGLRTSATDGNDAVAAYSYDGLNRLSQTDYTQDGETVAYAYDAIGNRLVMTDSVGTTSYQYDDLYRPIIVTDPFTGTVVYSYDRVGNRIGLTYPDGKQVTTIYDDDNRLQTVQDWDSGTTSYEYDAVG
ncbi:MAG: RHS repeat protein, partial [Chloroflexi bacterium]|nr:RHS repeat protein [Chloroflexota bacterium]